MASASAYTSFHSDRFENAEHLQRIKKLHNRLQDLRAPKRTKRRLKRRQSELHTGEGAGGLPTIISSLGHNDISTPQLGQGLLEQRGHGQEQGQRYAQRLEQRSQTLRRQSQISKHKNERQWQISVHVNEQEHDKEAQHKHDIPIRTMAGDSIAHQPSVRSNAMACSPLQTSRPPPLLQDSQQTHQPRPPEQKRTRALSWRGRLLRSEQLDEHERAMLDYERQLRTQHKRDEAAVVLRARMRERQRDLAAKRVADNAKLEAEERVRKAHALEQKKLRDQRHDRMAARARQRNAAKQRLRCKESGWDDTPPGARKQRSGAAQRRQNMSNIRRKGRNRSRQELPPGQPSHMQGKFISKVAVPTLPIVARAPVRAMKTPSVPDTKPSAYSQQNQQEQGAQQRNDHKQRRAQIIGQDGEVVHNADLVQQREHASRLIQAHHRGRKTRRQVAHGRASRLIQAQYRGRKARQHVRGLKAERLEEEARAAEAQHKSAEAKQKAAEDRIATAEAQATEAKYEAVKARRKAAEAKQKAAEARQKAAEAKPKAAEAKLKAAEDRNVTAEAQAGEANQQAAEDQIAAANAIAEAKAQQRHRIEKARRDADRAVAMAKRNSEEDKLAAFAAIAEAKAAHMLAASEQMARMISKMRHSALGRALRKWQDETALAAARAELAGKETEANEWEAELGELFVDEEQV
eukprot:g2960.t1